MSGQTVYSYVGNDPINHADPSGEIAEVLIPPIIVIAAATAVVCATTDTCKRVIEDFQRLLDRSRSPSPLLPMRISPFDSFDDNSMSAKDKGDSSSDKGNDRNPADDQKLTPGEIDKLKGGKEDPEKLKGGKATGQRDLFKDKKGNINVKPKDGSGPGDPTGLNIKDF